MQKEVLSQMLEISKEKANLYSLCHMLILKYNSVTIKFNDFIKISLVTGILIYL